MSLHFRVIEVPLHLVTDVLPIECYLSSDEESERTPHERVWLEMRHAQGRILIVTPERMHAEPIYVAHCVFDQYGTWHLTWKGLRNLPSKDAKHIVIEVDRPIGQMSLYEEPEMC